MALIKQGWAAALLAMAALPLSTSAGAQGAQSTQGSQVNYPTKPIRVVVPFSAGSATDILSRMIGPKLYEAWGQQVVTDNRPSAGGTVAGGIVASAAPDGYTLLLTSSAFAGSAALYDQLPYDTVRDFAGITQIASTPLVIVASPSLGLKSLKDLMARLKQDSSQVSVAVGSSLGSTNHIAMAMIAKAAGGDGHEQSGRGWRQPDDVGQYELHDQSNSIYM
mgnify:CR=1 FL=1